MIDEGSVDVLVPADVAVPEPGPSEILLRVAFAGVNFTDVMAREGLRMVRTRTDYPRIPGSEAAGLVVGVGEGVDPALVGRRMVAFATGAAAEYAVASARWAWEVPPGVPLPDSLALLVQGCTAHIMLHHIAGLSRGESVLVHSGAGGVGSLAIQLARLGGAGTVVATASSDDKRALCRELGATQVVDYRAPQWAARAAECAPRGFDIVLDAVGGAVTDESLPLLADFGRLVVYGLTSKELSPLAGSQLMAGNRAVYGFWLSTWMERFPELPVAELLTQLADGRLRVVLSPVRPLSELPTIHTELVARRTVGKLVVAL